MAHEICNFLDKNENGKRCDAGCSNYVFDHRETACVLSDVYSVKKNEICKIYKDKNIIVKS